MQHLWCEKPRELLISQLQAKTCAGSLSNAECKISHCCAIRRSKFLHRLLGDLVEEERKKIPKAKLPF